MNRYYELITQQPKPKRLGRVLLSVDQKGEALAFTGPDADARIVADMERAKLDFVGADGQMLSGFEYTGKYDAQGRKIYRYQEWWLVYTTEVAT
jgi:hypothetical protein